MAHRGSYVRKSAWEYVRGPIKFRNGVWDGGVGKACVRFSLSLPLLSSFSFFYPFPFQQAVKWLPLGGGGNKELHVWVGNCHGIENEDHMTTASVQQQPVAQSNQILFPWELRYLDSFPPVKGHDNKTFNNI